MPDAPAVVWLRQDLRLADNPALRAAIDSKRPLVLLYILDDDTPGAWKLGGASRWWLHRSLDALAKDIAKRGGVLTLRRGKAAALLPKLVKETGASAIFWNRCYEPHAVARDKALKEKLGAAGVEVSSHNGALLFEPWEVKTKSGEPFKVYTPFWRACLQLSARPPMAGPKKLNCVDNLASDTLSSWKLLPTKPNWAAGFESEWTPGEAGAQKALDRFIERALAGYPEGRDQMGRAGTSRLSPHLHFGELSPVQVRAVVETAAAHEPSLQRGADKYLAEIGWREFSTHLLFNWPTLPSQNWRAQFDAFPWRDDEKALRAWQRGTTGYPVVDAAMRELWATGYMHNRARMIAASFLIKHLLIDWRRGEDWFWDTLVDADLANNAASWQWVAGSGADASPYFRIFNPVTQGQRYDADGAYVRRWIPELSRLPDALLHKPWEADAATLRAAKVELDVTYPRPIVDHAAARARALEAFASL
ncbi:cryptochrome/photolyase family protein [Terricaulis sp.]|uniref:cryptochrome/photolyase family protein n=1 Tax=Terricaulis sp. TaxID=2768686 RepID=UPI0037848ED5